MSVTPSDSEARFRELATKLAYREVSATLTSELRIRMIDGKEWVDLSEVDEDLSTEVIPESVEFLGLLNLIERHPGEPNMLHILDLPATSRP